VRIANLSSEATEHDVRDLLSNFGPFARVFVAKDYNTGLGKGFAFITFYDRERAQQCIDKLDGFGYDSLILKVDWAKRT
jgi:translation initiation factor 3 subunit G